ncbi:MAG: dihydrolipoamide acetyltransferase family protein [Anaerolineales bacterium]
MPVEMIMPKVDMDQETGTVVEWRKQNGEQVTEGEIILVIETDKVAIDVESPGTGTLDGISAKPGDVVPIGTVIAYILAEGESLPEGAGKPAPVEVEAPAKAKEEAGPAVAATPVAQNMAAALGVDLASVSGTGRDGKVTKADVQAAMGAETSSPTADGKVYASPAARRIAREKGVDLSQVPGTGPKGRVQGFDVDAYTPVQPAGFTAPTGLPAGSMEPEVIPLIGMRKTIAERLTYSYQSTPHIKFTERVDMTNFNAARQAMNAHAEKLGHTKVSATALLVKLVAAALQSHPWLNSSLTDEAILLHKEINVGVAVALETGLIVPVVRNANLKSVSQLAAEINDLAGRAREGQLVSSEVKGGTFTISNLGPFGVEKFEAIINPPEAAILAVGNTHPEAVPMPDGQIVSRPMMYITLSADHRIVDGAVAARFITDLKERFENPILTTY